jgi:hypothetical protein
MFIEREQDEGAQDYPQSQAKTPSLTVVCGWLITAPPLAIESNARVLKKDGRSATISKSQATLGF